jgi:hypothetical protein
MAKAHNIESFGRTVKWRVGHEIGASGALVRKFSSD